MMDISKMEWDKAEELKFGQMARNISDFGRKTQPGVSENLYIKMEMNMMDNGCTIKQQVTAFIIAQMVPSMKENGEEICSMG